MAGGGGLGSPGAFLVGVSVVGNAGLEGNFRLEPDPPIWGRNLFFPPASFIKRRLRGRYGSEFAAKAISVCRNPFSS